MMADTPFHEAANIFPLMEGEAFKAFVNDIKVNGLQDEIAMYEGAILDGRNRYRACKEAGREPRFKDVNPDDPVVYVHSENLHRRQLTTPQLGMVAARTIAWYAKQANDRKRAGGRKGGAKSRQPDTPTIPPCPKKGKDVASWAKPSASPETEGEKKAAHRARDEAGAAVGVGGNTVQRSVRVLDYGSNDLQKTVDAGHLASNTAATLTYLPKTQQDEAAALAPSRDKKDKAKLKKLVDKAKTKKSPGKAKPAKKYTTPQLVENILKNINKLVALMETSDVGISKARSRVTNNLKVAHKYVKETEPYLQ